MNIKPALSILALLLAVVPNRAASAQESREPRRPPELRLANTAADSARARKTPRAQARPRGRSRAVPPKGAPRSAPKSAAQPTPRVVPGTQPQGGHTTIAPFPVPGDTSPEAVLRWKTLNRPLQGLTTVAPLPPPVSDPRVPGALADPRAPGQTPPLQIDVLPEAIERVAPVYPEAARAAGSQGTVMVQAHVLDDGTVGEVRVVRSVALLDTAALACVRQWRFKPATFQGKRVDAWVGIPIKFVLH